MRVPNEALRDTVSLEDAGASAAHGPTYGQARSLRASVQPTSRLITNVRGQVVSASVLVMLRPEAWPVAVGSRVTTQGQVYRVSQAYLMPDSRSPSHIELLLERFSTAANP